MKKIIVTGSSGLIGSKFVQAYQQHYQLIPFDLHGPSSVDITDLSSLKQAMITNQDATAILHLAAYTDVSGAYAQSGDKQGSAWQINVEGTKNLLKLASQYQLYFIHMSTAYIFDGEKADLYQEDDAPHPIEWYGVTKYEAESLVCQTPIPQVILRIDQPFSHQSFTKVDTLHRIILNLKSNNLPPQFTNHYFGPTYIEDLIKIIDFCLRTRLTGVYHASSGEKWSDYNFAQLVQKTLNLSGTIKKGDLELYLKTTARPYQKNTALNNQKLRQVLDFKLKTIKEAIKTKRKVL